MYRELTKAELEAALDRATLQTRHPVDGVFGRDTIEKFCLDILERNQPKNIMASSVKALLAIATQRLRDGSLPGGVILGIQAGLRAKQMAYQAEYDAFICWSGIETYRDDPSYHSLRNSQLQREQHALETNQLSRLISVPEKLP